MTERTDRGVSETIGYVIVVALILGTVTVVFVVGSGGLQSAGESERLATAERGAHVLAADIEDVAYDGAPRRRTAIRLAGGQLGFGDPVTVELRAENDDTGAPLNRTDTATIRPIVYEVESGASVVYSAGAVFRARQGGAAMHRRPDWTITDDRTAVTIINTSVVGDATVGANQSVAGRGDGVVRSRLRNRTVLVNDSGGYERLWINVTSPRAPAWNRTLDETNGIDCRLRRTGRAACEITGVRNLSTSRSIVNVSVE